MEGPKFEKATAGEKVAVILEKWRVALIIVLVAAVAGVAGYFIYASVKSSNNDEVIGTVDRIFDEYVEKSAEIAADSSKGDIEAVKAKALEELKPVMEKGGAGGVRANMLAAEIAFSGKKYEDAAAYYAAAAEKDKSAYTYPLVCFNAATCYENAGKLSDAAVYFEKAASYKEFIQAGRAYFNLGRVKEALNDVEGAKKAYTDLVDLLGEGSFVNLAKTRLIELNK